MHKFKLTTKLSLDTLYSNLYMKPSNSSDRFSIKNSKNVYSVRYILHLGIDNEFLGDDRYVCLKCKFVSEYDYIPTGRITQCRYNHDTVFFII